MNLHELRAWHLRQRLSVRKSSITRELPSSEKGASDAQHRPDQGKGFSVHVVQGMTALGAPSFSYSLTRSRRKTVCIRVEHGRVKVIAPMHATRERIESFLQAKQKWVLRHLQQQQIGCEQYGCTYWGEGGQLPLRGRIVRLHLGGTQTVTGLSENDCLTVNVPSMASEAEVRDAVRRWLYAYAQDVLKSKVAEIVLRSPKAPSEVRLSEACHQWGSCNMRGVIRLSWRLIFLDEPMINYVVAHELAHLQQMNHSQAFWRAVQEILPGYEQAKLGLRRISMSCLPL